MTATDTSIALVRAAARAAADKQAHDVVALDVSERLAITDAFLIASATSERQVNAVVDAIEEALAELGEKPVRREGRSQGRWVLLDYAQVIVHVQHQEDRVFYALERLWNDSPVIDITAELNAPANVPAGEERAATPDQGQGDALDGSDAAAEDVTAPASDVDEPRT
ncbi:ribosome silencing factor [Tersicoccus phoenicis]|uniref:ribosome silencing factor n=1 Tax=Tersicoccus phoenicis TaxID=554083 RepID=UPI0009FC0069|nr:ribosome silencing factor [Tersicoccus phoenicis]